MYKPTGTNSIWVSLGNVPWAWAAEVDISDPNQPKITSSSFHAVGSTNATELPMWTQTGNTVGVRFPTNRLEFAPPIERL